MSSEDPYDLGRFLSAQDEGRTYELALEEIQHGQKMGHWMWFVFPQIAGLGSSATARYFAISSIEEARAYLGHVVLGPRLFECAASLLQVAGRSAAEIFGPVDSLKLRSSMTLFMRAAPGETVFAEVLARFFDGQADRATEERL